MFKSLKNLYLKNIMKSEINPQLKVETEDGREAPQKPSLAEFVYPTNRGNK